MSEKKKVIKDYFNDLIKTEDGKVFMAYLLTAAGMFSNTGIKGQDDIRSWMISILGELDFYKDTNNFQLDYVKVIADLPGRKK